ncbi:hypothetical protein PN451_09245 [Dolichospermum planctonicum CS-1226]|uniref:Uncharacterized protein n=1 Tax=Dolichospermum planctonicum CS-1226 TaxID=3021751 RepID=A0ABT5AH12_9CYAN|nr:hypothetical protein [Dolichospermum planctonicum]MDB9536017.1 hypothetical protein [Dolichospermum planctonicum CS-1226]
MNNISPDSITLEDSNTFVKSETDSDTPQPLLPRWGWNNQITYLRLIFRAKKALDRIEKEAGIVRSES